MRCSHLPYVPDTGMHVPNESLFEYSSTACRLNNKMALKFSCTKVEYFSDLSTSRAVHSFVFLGKIQSDLRTTRLLKIFGFCYHFRSEKALPL